MGQYLAIGLSTNIIIQKSYAKEAKISFNDLKEKMQNELYFDTKIYNIDTDEDCYYFNLKPDVLSEQLVPLLEKIYPMLYPKENFYLSIIEKLNTMKKENWIKWAKEKPAPEFQFDDNGICEYLYGHFNNRVPVYYKTILLSLSGKIIMEAYKDIFIFFKRLLVNQFKNYSLSSAFRVYIAG